MPREYSITDSIEALLDVEEKIQEYLRKYKTQPAPERHSDKNISPDTTL